MFFFFFFFCFLGLPSRPKTQKGETNSRPEGEVERERERERERDRERENFHCLLSFLFLKKHHILFGKLTGSSGNKSNAAADAEYELELEGAAGARPRMGTAPPSRTARSSAEVGSKSAEALAEGRRRREEDEEEGEEEEEPHHHPCEKYCRASSAAPATTGVAIDVPLSTPAPQLPLLGSPSLKAEAVVPGAARSGLRRLSGVGPAEEK